MDRQKWALWSGDILGVDDQALTQCIQGGLDPGETGGMAGIEHATHRFFVTTQTTGQGPIWTDRNLAVRHTELPWRPSVQEA